MSPNVSISGEVQIAPIKKSFYHYNNELNSFKDLNDNEEAHPQTNINNTSMIKSKETINLLNDHLVEE